MSILCKCGCGQEVKAYRKGYRSFIHGHHRKGLTDIQKINIIQCLCGCGEELNEFDKRNRIRKYLPGHNHKGKFFSEEHKNKIGEANRKRVRRPAEIQRLRKLARQRIGKPLSEEHRFKISLGERERNGWNSIGEYPYEFNNVFKERIRKRENYCCALCSNPQIIFRRKLHIHHIDSDKKNTIDSNCITLCYDCHNKIHKKIGKEEGIIILKRLLNERYGYQYEAIYQECAPSQCM